MFYLVFSILPVGLNMCFASALCKTYICLMCVYSCSKFLALLCLLLKLALSYAVLVK